jgi:hypothetical protein
MSFGSGAGAADGYESTDAEGNKKIGSGRGSDTAGRQELYHRRHDPMAPGSTPDPNQNEPQGSGGSDPSQPISATNARVQGPVGTGGTMGRPSLGQAFKYNSYDRYTPAQNTTRTILGFLPFGGLVQGLMAGGAALNDMYGPKEGFGQIEAGDPSPNNYDEGNSPMVVKKNTPVASTQKAAAPTPTSKPNAATGIGGGKDTSPVRTRVAASGKSTVLTSPFGDLSQAPTAKKMLLGA